MDIMNQVHILAVQLTMAANGRCDRRWTKQMLCDGTVRDSASIDLPMHEDCIGLSHDPDDGESTHL